MRLCQYDVTNMAGTDFPTKEFTCKEHGFSFEYPAGWTADPVDLTPMDMTEVADAEVRHRTTSWKTSPWNFSLKMQYFRACLNKSKSRVYIRRIWKRRTCTLNMRRSWWWSKFSPLQRHWMSLQISFAWTWRRHTCSCDKWEWVRFSLRDFFPSLFLSLYIYVNFLEADIKLSILRTTIEEIVWDDVFALAYCVWLATELSILVADDMGWFDSNICRSYSCRKNNYTSSNLLDSHWQMRVSWMTILRSRMRQ